MAVKLAGRIESLVPSGIRAVNERALALEREGKKVFHFELGRPDFDTPEYIKRACVESLNGGDVFYTSNFGKPELRRAVAEYLEKRKHIPVTAENVLITVGLAEAVFDVLTALLEPGDEILVPDPVWMNYVNVPRLLGASPVPYALQEARDYQPDPAELERLITPRTRAIVIVSPNNPTGSVLGGDSLNAIAALARAHDLAVVSDEVYERITYGVRPHVSIASLPGMAERTITLNGYSKAYSMTGWRLGYVAADRAIIQALNKLHQINTTSAASFVQTAGIAALTGESGEVEAMREAYRRRRDFLVPRVNAIPGLSCREPDGAFYLFINAKGLPVSETEFAQYLLERHQVAVVPGTVFGANGAGYLRLSFASAMEELEEGAARIDRAARELLGG